MRHEVQEEQDKVEKAEGDRYDDFVEEVNHASGLEMVAARPGDISLSIPSIWKGVTCAKFRPEVAGARGGARVCVRRQPDSSR